MARSLRIRSRR